MNIERKEENVAALGRYSMEDDCQWRIIPAPVHSHRLVQYLSSIKRNSKAPSATGYVINTWIRINHETKRPYKLFRPSWRIYATTFNEQHDPT